MKWIRDGRLVTARPGRRVAPLEMATGREYLTLERPDRPDAIIGSFTIHPGGRLLAAASGVAIGGPAPLWDLATGRLVGSLPGPVSSLAFDGAGDLIVHGRSGVFFWPVRADSGGDLIIGPPSRIEAPEPGDGVFVVATSHDGRVVAATFPDGPVVLHRDRPVRPVRLGRQWDVRTMAVSPDGRWVAASSFWTGQGTRVYDATTGRPLARVPGDQSTTTFSRDGRWLMAISAGSVMHLVQGGHLRARWRS